MPQRRSLWACVSCASAFWVSAGTAFDGGGAASNAVIAPDCGCAVFGAAGVVDFFAPGGVSSVTSAESFGVVDARGASLRVVHDRKRTAARTGTARGELLWRIVNKDGRDYPQTATCVRSAAPPAAASASR